MKSKLFYGLGTLAAVATPAAAISCSCGGKSGSREPKITKPVPVPPPTVPIKAKLGALGMSYSGDARIGLIDLTKANNAEEVKKASMNFEFEEDFAKYVDRTYPEEIKEFLAWAETIRNSGSLEESYKKIGYVFYYKGEIRVMVYKFENPKDSPQYSSLKDLYVRGRERVRNTIEYLARRGDPPSPRYKYSGLINHLYDPNW